MTVTIYKLKNSKDCPCDKNYIFTEFPLWHNGINSISAVPGRKFNPWPAQCVKGTRITAAVWYRSQLQFRSDSSSRDSMCLREAKKEKKNCIFSVQTLKKYLWKL